MSLPTESLAVRVALASIVAVALAHTLVRAGVRTPRLRASLALVPGVSILVVTAVFVGAPVLPSLWHTVGSSGTLTVQVRDTYLSLSESTVPLFVAAWLSIAVIRVLIRSVRQQRARRDLDTLRRQGRVAGPRLIGTTRRLSAALKITPPDVVVVPSLPGGAAIVGMHDPVLLLDQGLEVALDEQELTGVVAHELAHVQRRDNHVALGLCLLRDVFFFVPGSMWSIRMLLREREHAADTLAVELTDRPGALASGLLKVLEGRSATAACSPLLSEGTLVARVEALCDDRPPPTRHRRLAEYGGVTMVVVGAVLAATATPALLTGREQERAALGLLLSDVEPLPPLVETPSTVFRAFEGAPDSSVAATVEETPIEASILDVGDADLAGPVGYEACQQRMAACRDRTLRVSMPPLQITRVDDGVVDRWHLEPIVRSQSQENALFWMGREAAAS